MKIPREAWWLLGLLVLVLIIVLLLGGERERSEGLILERTTYNSRPDGLRALYLTLRELGYEVRRLRTPFGDATLPERGTLVVVAPPMPTTERELEALQRWIARGHTVVVAGGWAVPAGETYFPRPRELWQGPPLTYARTLQPTYLAQGVKQLAVRATGRIEAPHTSTDAVRDNAEEMSGCPSCFSCPSRVADALQAAVPVMGDRKGTVVAYGRLGAGHIVLLSSPWSLSNEGIREADNLVFALNAVGPARSGPVHFDEYHHGYGENLAWGLLPLSLKIALGNLLLGILLVLYARSRRFGAAVPYERSTRERSEFLATMTALLRKGRATRLALRTSYDAVTQRLRAELGLPAHASTAELTRAASRLSVSVGERLGAALRQCSGALEGPETLSEARAMALIRTLDAAARSVRRI